MKKNIRRLFLFFLVLGSTLTVPCCKRAPVEPVLEEPKDSIPPIGFYADSLDLVEGTIRDGEIFTAIMNRLGMTTEQALALADASDTVFDVRKIRAGQTFQAYYRKDTTLAVADNVSQSRELRYFVYPVDQIDRIVFQCTPPLKVWKFSRSVENVLRYSDVTIRSSLWNDMIEAGSSPILILSLADIYAWTVDFFGLQEGDRFKVLYDECSVEGAVIDIDTVYYAEFQRDSTVLPAIRFDQEDGGNQYWNERGESLKKAFLKAPLRFTRISSGFSHRRRHPITGQIRPHTAVDYAAPTGTPVVSIGEGTVLSAGWEGGGGNTVRIRHNSVYTTAYLHLSRFQKGIKSGVRVRQGDVIGYVGSTGSSTGPHLDFRVWKNGTPINPLTMESPPTDPIRPENLPVLDSLFRHCRHLADSLSQTETLYR